MKIYDAIKRDHDHHRQLLDALAGTSGDSDERRAAWSTFFYDVKAHAAAEEECFYARLMATTHGQPDARHSVHEHQSLDEVLDDLNDMDMSSPGWLLRFKTLREQYQHHIDEEEEELFASAREQIGADADGRIGHAFRSRKAQEVNLVDRKMEEAVED